LEKFEFENKKKKNMSCKLTLQYGKEDPLLLELLLNVIIPKSTEDMCTVSIVVKIGGCSVRDPA